MNTTYTKYNDYFNYVLKDFETTFKLINDYEDYMKRPKIKKVIFNPPATIIMWNDGTKSVVKCQNGEVFDAEKGFALAYLKKLLGNDNTFNKEINKWVKYDAID